MILRVLLIFFFMITSLSSDMLSRTKVGMGTFITISVDENSSKYLENGFKIMQEVERSLSSYNTTTPIYKLNQDKNSTINAIVYEALALSREYYKQTNGYFDISVGSVTKDLYRFGEDERVPTKEELFNATIDFKGLRFNRQKAYIKDGMKIDLGGMGKGFGVDKVAEYFREQSINRARVSASGDIRCLGVCKIDVQDPFSDGILLSFKTAHKDVGISTSGNYNRYVKSTKNNHLINPKTKSSQDKFVSITLISLLPSADLDAYATAASVMPLNKAYKFLDSLDLAYIVLQNSGVLIFSKNINYYTKNLLIHNAKKK